MNDLSHRGRLPVGPELAEQLRRDRELYGTCYLFWDDDGKPVRIHPLEMHRTHKGSSGRVAFWCWALASAFVVGAVIVWAVR